VTAIT